ncbi:MAG: hypothetical protein PHY85_00920, partial [Bacteroidales bacterium]|nr:hypothetical protein [Bacteroidales bacterium]
NNPSLDIVMKILTAFPDIDSDWLMFGDGKMYKDEISNIQPESPALQSNKQALEMMDLFSAEETAEESEENEIAEIHQNELKNTSHESSLLKSEIVPNKAEIRDEEPALYIKTNLNNIDNPESSNNTNVEKESENHPKKEEKQIRKIVFFYTDKSFSEYYPEN